MSRTFSGVIGVPLNWTEPVSGRISPIISRKSVDLPQPLGPISTVVCPAGTARSVDRSAAAVPYDFETLFSSIIRASHARKAEIVTEATYFMRLVRWMQ